MPTRRPPTWPACALPAEVRALSAALKPAQAADLCTVEVETNTSVSTLVHAVQRPHPAPLAIFHYAGHASGDALFLESDDSGPAQAHAAGLARMLGNLPGLQLVFLNGCSTEPQVRRLLELGVPAVIATSRAIDDGVATRFAERFYQRLAQGAAIGEAYTDAESAVQVAFGEGGALFRTGVTRSQAPQAEADDLPWRLYTASGADAVRIWSLPAAAGDPLFGLPPLPDLDLPPSPFLHLRRYEREHCGVFFGRAAKIRELYDALTAERRPPVTVLYGPSGAGKSSLLEAGLLPRLEADHDVVVLRRDLSVGLPAMLADALKVADPAALPAAWHARETGSGRPLIVILDQIEEVVTRPLATGDDELTTVIACLKAVFGRPIDRPRGRVLLTLRAEWLASLLGRLEETSLPVARVELRHLGAEAVEEIIRGPASRPRLADFYRLQVEAELPALIAQELTADSEAAVAPTLAVLLRRLWDAAVAAHPARPVIRVADYQELKRGGLLDDFVEQQLQHLARQDEGWVDSGLTLDVWPHLEAWQQPGALRRRAQGATPTSPTSIACSSPARTCACWRGRSMPRATSCGARPRLAHDTLGPLIRARFEASNLPGQRARRIIRERVRDWEGDKVGGLLTPWTSLVLRGLSGMAALRQDGQRLLEASVHHQRVLRRDRRLIWIGVASLLLTVLGTAWLVWAGRVQARVVRLLTAEGNALVVRGRARRRSCRHRASAPRDLRLLRSR
ncbi:MAG: CHAT domain-containing protein [bacterium]